MDDMMDLGFAGSTEEMLDYFSNLENTSIAPKNQDVLADDLLNGYMSNFPCSPHIVNGSAAIEDDAANNDEDAEFFVSRLLEDRNKVLNFSCQSDDVLSGLRMKDQMINNLKQYVKKMEQELEKARQTIENQQMALTQITYIRTELEKVKKELADTKRDSASYKKQMEKKESILEEKKLADALLKADQDKEVSAKDGVELSSDEANCIDVDTIDHQDSVSYLDERDEVFAKLIPDKLCEKIEMPEYYPLDTNRFGNIFATYSTLDKESKMAQNNLPSPSIKDNVQQSHNSSMKLQDNPNALNIITQKYGDLMETVSTLSVKEFTFRVHVVNPEVESTKTKTNDVHENENHLAKKGFVNETQNPVDSPLSDYGSLAGDQSSQDNCIEMIGNLGSNYKECTQSSDSGGCVENNIKPYSPNSPQRLERVMERLSPISCLQNDSMQDAVIVENSPVHSQLDSSENVTSFQTLENGEAECSQSESAKKPKYGISNLTSLPEVENGKTKSLPVEPKTPIHPSSASLPKISENGMPFQVSQLLTSRIQADIDESISATLNVKPIMPCVKSSYSDKNNFAFKTLNGNKLPKDVQIDAAPPIKVSKVVFLGMGVSNSSFISKNQSAINNHITFNEAGAKHVSQETNGNLSLERSVNQILGVKKHIKRQSQPKKHLVEPLQEQNMAPVRLTKSNLSPPKTDSILTLPPSITVSALKSGSRKRKSSTINGNDSSNHLPKRLLNGNGKLKGSIKSIAFVPATTLDGSTEPTIMANTGKLGRRSPPKNLSNGHVPSEVVTDIHNQTHIVAKPMKNVPNIAPVRISSRKKRTSSKFADEMCASSKTLVAEPFSSSASNNKATGRLPQMELTTVLESDGNRIHANSEASNGHVPSEVVTDIHNQTYIVARPMENVPNIAPVRISSRKKRISPKLADEMYASSKTLVTEPFSSLASNNKATSRLPQMELTTVLESDDNRIHANGGACNGSFYENGGTNGNDDISEEIGDDAPLNTDKIKIIKLHAKRNSESTNTSQDMARIAKRAKKKKLRLLKGKLRAADVEPKASPSSVSSIEKVFQDIDKLQYGQEHMKLCIHSFVTQFLNPRCVPDVNCFIEHIIKYLVTARRNPFIPFSESKDFSVLLPPAENCIIMAIDQVDKKHKLHLNMLVPNLVKCMARVILAKDNATIYGLSALCRVMSGLCMLRKDHTSPLMLCYNLLIMKHKFASFLVASVAGVWKDLFHLDKEQFEIEHKMICCIPLALPKEPGELNDYQFRLCNEVLTNCLVATPLTQENADCILEELLYLIRCNIKSVTNRELLVALVTLITSVMGCNCADVFSTVENLSFDKSLPLMSMEIFLCIYCNLCAFFSRKDIFSHYMNKKKDNSSADELLKSKVIGFANVKLLLTKGLVDYEAVEQFSKDQFKNLSESLVGHSLLELLSRLWLSKHENFIKL